MPSKNHVISLLSTEIETIVSGFRLKCKKKKKKKKKSVAKLKIFLKKNKKILRKNFKS